MIDIVQFTEPENGYMRGSQLVDRTRHYDPGQTPFALTYGHAAVHRDIIINYTNTVVSSALTRYFIKTGNPLSMHVIFRVLADSRCDIKMYEGSTVSADGTAQTAFRLNRESTKDIQAQIFLNPTVSNIGTLIYDGYNGGGGQGSGAFGGSLAHDDAEWIFKQDENYIIEVSDGSALDHFFEMEWYEVPKITL
jgi:hypothetical protein